MHPAALPRLARAPFDSCARRRGRLSRTALATLALTIAVAACSGSKSEGATDTAPSEMEPPSIAPAVMESLPAATPSTYSPGTAVTVAEKTLGADGGTLTGAPGTPVEGVVVTVPAGALAEPTTLSLGYDDGVFTNIAPEERGPVIVLRSSGSTRFQKPLKVEFPYASADRVPVPYYIHEDGTLEIVTPLPFDRSSGRAGFVTWHASDYTFTNAKPDSPAPLWNQFSPMRDGFLVNNAFGSKYVLTGRCWGMANFAKWYRQHVGPGLAEQFLDPVPTAVGLAGIPGQKIVTIRAHNAVAYYEPQNSALAPEQPDFSVFATQVKDALSRGARSVMISLRNGSVYHAVLAVGFTDDQIAVYDPNWPQKWKAIDYRKSPHYGDYKAFALFGNGELALNERYERVLEDARAGFEGENETKIEITSHQPDQRVTSASVTLEGRIHSGQVLIGELDAWVVYPDGSASPRVTLPMPPSDDTFAVALTLKKGMNAILFETRGWVAFTGMQPILHTPEVFVIELAQAPARPDSRIAMSTTRVVRQPSQRKVETSSLSANLVYQTYRADRILSLPFDFAWCDRLDGNCEILGAQSWDSLDVATRNLLPLSIAYHFEIYDIDADGNEVLMTYGGGEGAVTCTPVVAGIHVEPGSTAETRSYRLLVDVGACFPPELSTATVTGRQRVSRDSDEWRDTEPGPLSPAMAHSISASNQSTEPLACERVARVPATDLESWIAEQATPKTWTLTTALDGCDYSGDGTTIDETTRVDLTVVPNLAQP